MHRARNDMIDIRRCLRRHFFGKPGPREVVAMLIRMLMDIQRRFGHLPKAELASLAQALGIAKARVWDVASYFPHFRHATGPDFTIGVCRDLACHLSGSDDLLQSARTMEEPGKVDVEQVSCLGRCDSACRADRLERPADCPSPIPGPPFVRPEGRGMDRRDTGAPPVRARSGNRRARCRGAGLLGDGHL